MEYRKQESFGNPGNGFKSVLRNSEWIVTLAYKSFVLKMYL